MGVNRPSEPDFYVEKLNELWPEEVWPPHRFHRLVNEVYTDLEYLLEHIPMKSFFSKEIDWEDWCQFEYYVVYLDWLVLGHDRPPDELLACRNLALRELNTRIDEFYDAKTGRWREQAYCAPMVEELVRHCCERGSLP